MPSNGCPMTGRGGARSTVPGQWSVGPACVNTRAVVRAVTARVSQSRNVAESWQASRVERAASSTVAGSESSTEPPRRLARDPRPEQLRRVAATSATNEALVAPVWLAGSCPEILCALRRLVRVAYESASDRSRPRALAARGESQSQARARDYSSDQGAKPQTYWSISTIWEHRAGAKDPLSARSDFCHGLLGIPLYVQAGNEHCRAEDRPPNQCRSVYPVCSSWAAVPSDESPGWQMTAVSTLPIAT